jgi:isoleucyl-tRNA synthetase
VQLSAIYHDVVKDRLYTDAANSPRRRSTQTALHSIVVRLCQMLAPMLVFTAEEAWGYIPGAPAKSVHLSDWQLGTAGQIGWEEAHWFSLMTLRANVLRALEDARKGKIIGKTLEARLVLRGGLKHWFGAMLSSASNRSDDFKELVGVSALELEFREDLEDEVFEVTHALGQKCERCWHWEPVIGGDPAHPGLCPRCVEAVKACTA